MKVCSGTDNSTWDIIRDNVTISAVKSLGYHKCSRNKRWFKGDGYGLVKQREKTGFRGRWNWLWYY